VLPCALFYGQRLSCCNKKEIGIAKKKGNCQQFGRDEDGRLGSRRLATKVAPTKPFEGRLSYQLGGHNRRGLVLGINYSKIRIHSTCQRNEKLMEAMMMKVGPEMELRLGARMMLMMMGIACRIGRWIFIESCHLLHATWPTSCLTSALHRLTPPSFATHFRHR